MPKRTAVTPVKPVPVIIIGMPCPALVGEKEVIDAGGRVKVNCWAESAVLFAVTTCITPLAPEATIAVMLVGLLTVKDCAATPPKRTALTLVKFVPEITTDVP